MIRVRLSVSSPTLKAGLHSLLSGDPEIVILDRVLEDEPQEDGITDADVEICDRFGKRSEGPALKSPTRESGIILLGGDSAEVRRLMHGTHPWGALPLDAAEDELSAAVRAVAAGLVVGTRSLLDAAQDLAPPASGPLTEREIEILGLISRGLANKQIAAELGITEHTVKFHVSSIYTKLGASSRTEAVRAGLLNGWIAL